MRRFSGRGLCLLLQTSLESLQNGFMTTIKDLKMGVRVLPFTLLHLIQDSKHLSSYVKNAELKYKVET